MPDDLSVKTIRPSSIVKTANDVYFWLNVLDRIKQKFALINIFHFSKNKNKK